MKITSTNQLKAKIKAAANERGVDPRIMLRLYMMERFLERVSVSQYAQSFVLKGGMLISYLIGVNLRTTQDIDTTIINLPFTRGWVERFIDDICAIPLDDGVEFRCESIAEIMEGMDYPGIRVSLLAMFEKTRTSVKLDISTGHEITPSAVGRSFTGIFSETFTLLSYPVETIVAEKLHTVLSRGRLNTRMRDFYDLYALKTCVDLAAIRTSIKAAIYKTFVRRSGEHLLFNSSVILNSLREDSEFIKQWNIYCSENEWARHITMSDVMSAVESWVLLAAEESGID